MRKACTVMLIAAVTTLNGCGGAADDAATTATNGGEGAVVEQKVTRYETELDAAQANRLFGHSDDDVPPADLVGRWEMQLNETLGLLEMRSPDGAGPILEIVEDTGDTLVLEERECPKPFVMGVRRTSESLTLTPRSGGCEEIANLLAEEPWRVQ